jgi:two-component system sensor histidine kinase UhpB
MKRRTAARLAWSLGAIAMVAILADGVGFDPAARGYGTGLQGMADRLAVLGGTITVTSTPGQGATVAGRVPIDSRHAGS